MIKNPKTLIDHPKVLIEHLKTQIERFKTQIEHLITQIERSKTQIEHFITQIERSKTQIEHFKTQIEHLITQIERSKTQIEHLITQIEHPKVLIDLPITLIDLPKVLIKHLITLIDLPKVLIKHPITLIDLPKVLIKHPITLIDLPKVLIKHQKILIKGLNLKGRARCGFNLKQIGRNKTMRMKTGHCLLEVGKRLRSIRAEIGCNRSVMAQRLGLKQKTYYKNEVGLALPCFETLQRLQNEFDISMDWLLFKKGPIHTKDKEVLIIEEKKTTGIENTRAEVKELLTAMEQDQAFLHEIMLYYYNHKNYKQR